MPSKQPEPVATRRSRAPAAAKPEIGKADVAMPEPTRPSPSPPARQAPPRPSAPRVVAAPSARGTDEVAEVAARAYAKWLARGCPIGDDKRDWFEAQEEVRRERTR